MILTPLPICEQARLEDLRYYDILDSEIEKEFDGLAKLAAWICDCPIAAISFIDSDRQWFKAIHGLDARQTRRESAFCAHTILQDDVMVIENALEDLRFVRNELVTGPTHFRFYAGAPIFSDKGYQLGAVCVLDRKPRGLDPEKREALQLLSEQATALLRLRLKNRLLESHKDADRQKQDDILLNYVRKQEHRNIDVSTELHENLAQGLAASKFYLEIIEERYDRDLVRKCRENISLLINQTRDLSRKVFPTTLQRSGIQGMIEQLLNDQLKIEGRTVRFQCSLQRDLHTDLDICLYRVAEEQVRNILAHSEATEVFVNLRQEEQLRLTIRDNGRGADPAKLNRGFGLNTISSVINYFKGSVEVESAPGKGFTLEVFLPNR